MKPRKWLVEVDYLRVISVLLLVLDHTFIIYAGGWEQPNGIQNVDIYFWLGKFFMCIMLPLYVFISGYTYSSQIAKSKESQSFKQLIVRKMKRLMLPCWIFSALHIIIFSEYDRVDSLVEIIFFLFTGIAHLWFLPMLFYCFIIMHICRYLIMNKVISNSSLCIFALAASILTLNLKNIIFGGGLYYFSFFYMGYIFFIKREQLYAERAVNILLLTAFFIVNFIAVILIQEQVSFLRSGTLIQKLCWQWSNHLITLPMILSGIYVVYRLCCKLIGTKLFYGQIHKVAKYSFGIYIIHHFILELIYYRSPMPGFLGSYWLPIVSFVLAFTISYILALVAKRMPIIRYII